LVRVRERALAQSAGRSRDVRGPCKNVVDGVNLKAGVNHMARRISNGWRLAVALLFLATALLAHHSFGAEYDATKPVTLTGVITKIDWTNPHSYFFLDVKDDKGKVANWKLEGYPPSVLSRTGWKKDVTMKVGDTVTVFGWHARDG